MKLTLGFSPCPNDTFIFDALVNKKIDAGDTSFDVVLADVQQLNEWALEGRLDVSKISYGVLPLVLERYQLLTSGGALGIGVGPLLISRAGFDVSGIDRARVAIPGRNTTAHLLFSYAFPRAKNRVFMVFNEIEDAVLAGHVDAGVIIHENRFTYHLKGLKKLADLGTYWEEKTKGPIPLGGIVIKKSLGQTVAEKIEKLIRSSVGYSLQHDRERLTTYVREHAQEMSEDVMRQHIDLYVNDYSVDLGEDGKKAVSTLLQVYAQVYAGNDVTTL